ncbi:hypothetical protein JCM6882_007440 [Rhodosporidiobolus microsporus]
MSLPLRASSPVRYPPPPSASLPLLARLAPLLAILLLSLLLAPSLFPSPWLSSASSHPLHIFLRPPLPVVPPLTHAHPVSGCRDTSLTALEGRENAAVVVLLREKDLAELLPTLRNFEDKINALFRYPYVFLASPDEGDLSPSFRRAVAEELPADAVVEYGVVPAAHWAIPPWMDEEEVRRGFVKQEEQGVQYAGREGYHHMCRWYAGLWVRHPLLAKYDWFWRLEPGVRFYCSITYDPIRFLASRHKLYGFTISVVENANTIPTLFDHTLQYMDERGMSPRRDVDPALWGFLTRRNAAGKEEFTGCHFWTNMEGRLYIGDLRFFRSKEYQDYFRFLDEAGGFYTERWGDAPVRALALGLFARIDQIHHFSDLAYQHDWFLSCPRRSTSRIPSTGRDPLLHISSAGKDGLGVVEQKDVVGCRCECPKEGELQGREEGQGIVDMGTDWRFSCLEQWEAAVRKSRGL